MLDRSLGVAVMLSFIGAPGVAAQLVRRAPVRYAEPAGAIQVTLPATMRGGDTVSGSVLLPANAPVGGVRVTFSSDHPELAGAVQAVTVPAFQRSAGFAVAAVARRGAPAGAVTITASASGPTVARGSRAISVVQAAAAQVLVMPTAAATSIAISGAGQAVINSRLEPAPPVQDWLPRSRAPVGSSIVITGSGFRPADVAVRIGTRKLTLVETTPTRIVARAPSGTDPGVLDPHYAGPLTVGHAGGQLRTLTESYRVVDRWDGYMPTVAGLTRSQPLRLTDGVPRQWFAKFDVSLDGLPGDEVIGVAATPADGSCGQQLYPGGGARPVTDGKASFSVSMNFRLSALSCSRLQLPVRLRYRDQPDAVHIVTVDLGPVQLRTVLRVEETRQLVDAGVISFTGHAPSGTCSGQVDGTTVGRITIDGDVAFRVHDELGGPRCLWQLDQSLESGKWIMGKNGWAILRFGWTNPPSPAGRRCFVQREPRVGSELGVFFFERGQVFMGRDIRNMAPDSIMNVAIGCTSTAQQLVVTGIDPNAPHTETVQLDWVELAAPLGSTRWQQLQE